jgi:uncharacterized membrane protein
MVMKGVVPVVVIIIVVVVVVLPPAPGHAPTMFALELEPENGCYQGVTRCNKGFTRVLQG